MTQVTGKVTNVYNENNGSTLANDSAIGDSVLYVDESFDFEETGGVLEISGVQMDYLSVDYDADAITLAVPMVAAYLQDEPVLTVPSGSTKWAMVDLDDADEGIQAFVPTEMSPVLGDGVRDFNEQETVICDDSDGRWKVITIDGETPVVQGGYVSGEGLPAPIPVDPPATSPEIRATGTTVSIIVEADSVVPGTRIQYHISITPGFVPDSTTLVDTTQSQVLVIKGLPDGTPLDLEAVYYLKAVAENDAGVAASTSSEILGALNLDNIDSVVAAKLIAGFILSGHIDVGQMSIDADDGITIYAPGGGLVLHFPSNGVDDLEITARMTATLLNVQGDFSISGSGKVYGTFALNNGIGTPTVVPTLGKTYVSIIKGTGNILNDGSGPADLTGWCAGLIEKPGSTTDVAFVSIFGGSKIRFMRKADATWGLDLTAASWNTQFYGWGGLTYVATPPSGVASYYVLGSDNNRSGDVYIYRINASSGAKISELHLGNSGTFGGYHPRLVSDGTRLGMVWVPASKVLTLRWYVADTFAVSGADVNLVNPLPARGSVSGAVYGNADIGSARLFVAVKDVSGYTKVMSFNPASSYARVTTQDFDRAGVYLGLTYDTTNSQMVAYDTAGTLWKHGKYATDKTITAKMAWYDGDATGGTHETAAGPATTAFVLPARSYLRLVAQAPPDATNMDTSNHDRANQVRLYATDDGGTNWHLFTYTASPWSSSVPALTGITTGTPGSGTAFPSSVTPGTFKSDASDGGGPLIQLLGSGAWRLGNLASATGGTQIGATGSVVAGVWMSGIVAATSDASSILTFTHGLGVTPKFASVTGHSTLPLLFRWVNQTTTTVSFEVRRTDTNVLQASTALTVSCLVMA